jgi:hypothetical protein
VYDQSFTLSYDHLLHLGLALHHRGLECGPVRISQREVIDDGVEVVAGLAVSILQRVCVPVLKGHDRLKEALILAFLQAACVLHTEPTVSVRIFAGHLQEVC